MSTSQTPSKALVKTLLRSFLRWNRQPHVSRSPFALDDQNYRFSKYLTGPNADPRLQHVKTIHNSEQFQYLIYHIFRTYNNPNRQDIDHAFSVLRNLNTLSERLQLGYKLHLEAVDPEVLKHRVHKVGDVVRNLDGVRGVVCGWHIKDHMQYVYVLLDSFDQDVMVPRNKSQVLQPMAVFTAPTLTSVTRHSLQYIHNEHLSFLFSGFDTTLRRYVPRVDLSFRYAGDMDAFRNLYHQDGMTLNINPMTDTNESSEKEIIAKAAIRILKAAGGTTKAFKNILQSHGLVIPPISSHGSANTQIISSPARILSLPSASSTTIGFQSPLFQLKQQLSFQDIAERIIPELLNNIREMERITSFLMSDDVIHSSEDSLMNSTMLAQSLLRGSRFMNSLKLTENSFDYRTSVKSTAHHITINVNDMTNDNHLSNSSPRNEQIESKGNISLEKLIQDASRVLALHSECMESIDTMLQLRHQSKGITFHEGLIPSLQSIEAKFQSSMKSEKKKSSKLSTQDKNILISHPADTLSAGPAKFQFGARIRHLKFGYRGIVIGWDQRPNLDVSNWEAVIGLPSGENQPFYKVLADENDVERIFGSNYQSPEYYYVAEENIELLPKHSSFNVQNRRKAYYLQGFDESSTSFFLPTKLSFCFAPTNKIAKDEMPTTISDQDEVLDPHYQRLESLLMDIYACSQYSMYYSQLKHQHKQISSSQSNIIPEVVNDDEISSMDQAISSLTSSLSSSPIQSSTTLSKSSIESLIPPSPLEKIESLPSQVITSKLHKKLRDYEKFSQIKSISYDLSDITKILSAAPNIQTSTGPESMIYHIELAHADSVVRKWIRQGMSYLKRSKLKEADDCFSMILKNYDPLYVAAHSKRIIAYHNLDNISESLKVAEEVLKYYPEHYSTLTSIGLLQRESDNWPDAKKSIEKGLSIHPWLRHLPTFVNSIVTKEAKLQPSSTTDTESNQ